MNTKTKLYLTASLAAISCALSTPLEANDCGLEIPTKVGPGVISPMIANVSLEDNQRWIRFRDNNSGEISRLADYHSHDTIMFIDYKDVDMQDVGREKFYAITTKDGENVSEAFDEVQEKAIDHMLVQEKAIDHMLDSCDKFVEYVTSGKLIKNGVKPNTKYVWWGEINTVNLNYIKNNVSYNVIISDNWIDFEDNEGNSCTAFKEPGKDNYGFKAGSESSRCGMGPYSVRVKNLKDVLEEQSEQIDNRFSKYKDIIFEGLNSVEKTYVEFLIEDPGFHEYVDDMEEENKAKE